MRDYQTAAINNVNAEWTKNKNVILVMPCRSGKTHTFGQIIKDEPGSVVVIAHRAELLTQISQTLGKREIVHKIIGSAGTIKECARASLISYGKNYIDPAAHVIVASVDTLIKTNPGEQWLKTVRLWVIDECFIAGTLVDGKVIENLKVGDYTTAYNEQTKTFSKQRITHIFKNPAPKNIVRVNISGHHVLWCTFNHPFMTKRGWVNAINITENDEVLTYEMPYLQQRIRKYIKSINVSLQEKSKRILLKVMQYCLSCGDKLKDYARNKFKIRIGANEEKQSNEKPRDAGKSEQNFKVDWAQADGTRGERETYAKVRAYYDGIIKRFGVYIAISNKDERKKEKQPIEISNMLQTGLWQPIVKTCYRVRRSIPFGQKGSRRQKRKMSVYARVDSITIFKSDDINGTARGYHDGFVYNIEVENDHTYIANGVVVHNCHHVLAHEFDDETGKTIKGNKWGAVINLFTNARGLGVTATPTRSDGKGLGIESDGVFNSMVIGVKNAELEARGFIAPYRIYAPRSYIDLSNVTTGAGGDYVQAKLNKAVHESKITGDVVTHYLKLIPNKTAMVFCVDVEAATEQAAAFNAAGTPAMAASAKTPAIERINLKRKFDAGLIKVICNVDLYGEGVDVPSLEAVILARPSKSFPLVVQQFSRALTFYPDKTALIIDHVGNIEQHSRDWIKYIVRGEWTLNPADKKSRSSILPPTVRTCPLCFGVYPRDQGVLCPYCNERPPVALRKTIEQVEGDLMELAPETLQALQGKVSANEKDYPIPYVTTWKITARLLRLSGEKREVLHGLRKVIGEWYRGCGLDVPTAQRVFYLTFGYDVLTVQTLEKNEMIAITEVIRNEIEK